MLLQGGPTTQKSDTSRKRLHAMISPVQGAEIMNGVTNYLKDGRLADVLALIQVLAFDRDTSRTEDGLNGELQRNPTVGKWVEVAKDHPEFFRVRAEQGRTVRVALIARYVAEYVKTDDGDEKRPPLDGPSANKLMELAIKLYEEQRERRNWLKVWMPMIIALISAFTTVVVAVFKA